MSQENLEQFMEKVADSEELKASIENQLDSDGNISVDALIALGAENGCEFTPGDLQEAAELSDEQLDGVSGGMHQGAMNSVRPKGQYEPAGQVYFTPVGGGNEKYSLWDCHLR
jgi:predicted ribosomally synthesized peptide with nif11-like leader